MASSTPFSNSDSLMAMPEQGLAFQQTVGKLLADTMTNFTSLAKLQERTLAFAETMAQANQENADEAIDYIKRGARSKRELIDKALRPGVNPIELWAITTAVVCANMQAVWRTGMRAVETSVKLALPPRS